MKVIVDELPINCSACRWWEHGAYTGLEVLCGLVLREIDVDKLSTRPDWCPLELDTDYKFRIINRRNQALGLPDDDGL